MKLEHLSASTLESYEACPRRLWKRKIDDPKHVNTVFTEIGRSVHRALELYHTEGLGKHNNLAELYDEVCKEFTPLDFGKFSDMRTLLQQYEQENPLPTPTIGVEIPFEFKVGDFDLVGYIDRIDYLGDGQYEIVDYKTSYLKKEEEELRHDVQGVIYDIALRKSWEQDAFPGLPEPESVTFSLYFIRYGKVSVEYDQDQRDNALAFVEYTGHRIEMDDDEPEARLNSYCRSCEYRGDCSLFSGDWRKYVDEEIYGDLDQLVGSLEKLKHIKKIIEAKTAEINTQILVELESRNETSYLNKDGITAKIQSQARSAYDTDAIMKSLPDWTKYGTVDVKAVLEDGSPQEKAVVNRYTRKNRTRPYINTRHQKF